MPLTILSVAYTRAPVGPDAVGGAEQIVSMLDEAIVAAGHRSLVIACEGSSASGRLLPAHPSAFRAAIEHARRQFAIDVIHMHGFDWHENLPAPGTPLLATLHLPPDWYPPHVFSLDRPATYLNCVSQDQRSRMPDCRVPVFTIANGVRLHECRCAVPEEPYVFALGRICPEKGFHIAIDAAKNAGMKMMLAGAVFPYPEHVAYYEREILPRLDNRRTFIGPVSGERKRLLLAGAQALLVPSLAAETSSLVAMEALTCGTPVIAYRAGALPEIIEHARTGFLVGNQDEMAEAIARAPAIDSADCVHAARTRFAAARMTSEYLSLCTRLARRAEPILNGVREAAMCP